MTSSTRKQETAIHMLTNISRGKYSQKPNLVSHDGSVENVTWEIFFFKNYADYKAGKLFPDFFLFFEKDLMK